MHNVLVTGSNGQLGSEIKEVLNEIPGQAGNDGYHFFFTDRNDLDITDVKAIEKFVASNKIDIIINCAAYTAVDKAESDEVNADLVNHIAVQYLSEISKENNIKLIHVSTDYVFDGKNYKPYVEDDAVNPNGVYGKTKLDGEKAMQDINPKNSIIIRTSWVYSSFGANFVKTMLRLGKEKDEIGVIFDQVGTPTYAHDLARAILEIVHRLDSRVKPNNDGRGHSQQQDRHSQCDCESNVEIYHYSNEGVLSWYDFAKEIMRMAKLDCKIIPIETKEYPTPAKRPYYSLLNKAKIKKTFNITIPYWKDSLDECLKKLGEKK